MVWSRTHEAALAKKRITGSRQDTLPGHARDFAALLEASEPFIQNDELIVGSCLAVPQDEDALDLGFYDPHFPPGYRNILRMGLAGMSDNARMKLGLESDPDKQGFLEAVTIAYDAACGYVAKYALCAAEMAALESDPRRKDELKKIAAVCDELAVAPPSSFHAALQLVQFTRIFGGNGCIGRFDQWMFPFYERDLINSILTREEAQELLECFLIKLNEFPIAYVVEYPTRYCVWPRTADDGRFRNDSMRNIMLAGQTPNGSDACNELTVMCLKAAARLMLPEPKLGVRFFGGSPHSLLRLCCRIMVKGLNVLAIFNDGVVIPALTRLGIPIEDARDYCNDGCSELIIDGRSFSRFEIHDSLSALNETVQHAETHVYPTFRDVMQDLKSRVLSFVPDRTWDDGAITFPYFAASIDDCLREASPTGARYSRVHSQ
jgi:pyruvate-formate lyase